MNASTSFTSYFPSDMEDIGSYRKDMREMKANAMDGEATVYYYLWPLLV